MMACAAAYGIVAVRSSSSAVPIDIKITTTYLITKRVDNNMMTGEGERVSNDATL